MPLAFFRRHVFLIALAAALGVGFTIPDQVLRLEEIKGFRSSLVAIVLFLMGLTVPTKAFQSAIRNPMAGIVAILLNIGLVPSLAALAALGLSRELGGGLIVAAAAPCTLASAIVWTRRGGGDEATAMIVTIFTNFFCFLIAPTTLLLLLGTSVPIRFSDQATKLGLLVVAPLIMAQIVRQNETLGVWTLSRKTLLTKISLAGILTMVALGAAHSFSKTAHSAAPPPPAQAPLQKPILTVQKTEGAGGAEMTGAEDQRVQSVASDGATIIRLAMMLLAAILVHGTALGAGWVIAGKLRLPRGQQTAVAIAGSQKTLMVGLQIAIDCSVSTIPMVAYHLCQLVIDTLFASRVALLTTTSDHSSNHPNHHESVKNDAEGP